MRHWTAAALATALALALAAASRADAQTQPRVTITDLGPGPAGRLLRDALQRPHVLVLPETAAYVQPRGQRLATSLVVLGRPTYLAGRVEGDVVVVDADVFLRPGAEVTGRVIAIGGGAYPSSLALIRGSVESYRDFTYNIAPVDDGFRLTYRSLRADATPPLFLPYVYGLRLPSYDRVNGASIRFGPALSFAGGRGELNALATYRSDLGKVDPSVDVGLRMTRRTRAHLFVGRETFSNEDWIWPDLLNSASVLIFGEDTRNHYRADRAELTLHRRWEWTRSTLEPLIGPRLERAWWVGPSRGDRSGPWSMLGRRDTLAMLRPNPSSPIETYIISALTGAAYSWEVQDFHARARSVLEVKLAGELRDVSQLVSDLLVGFLTFGEQSYELEVHHVTTFGKTPPLQRAHYLGGPGTLPFLEMLEQGGGELLLVDQRYSIPLTRVNVGFMGMPTLQLRHRVGGAGSDILPELEQMLGVGISLTVIRGEVQIDPSSGKARFSLGFTFAR